MRAGPASTTARAGPDRGPPAASPWALPAGGWKRVLLGSWREASEDSIGLVAAGVAFYGFLALMPLIGAVVLSYGLVAKPDTVIRNMKALTAVMPVDAARIVGEQLMAVVRTSGTKKGLGLLFAFLVALFGARNGAGSIMMALNIAYEEEEKRGFVRVNLTALALTAGGVVAAILAVVAIAALGHLGDLLPSASGPLLILGKLFSYVLLFFGGAAGTATLYRYAPSRAEPRRVWLTPGSLFTSTLWLLLTLGFGVYVAHVGHYNVTYGSLGAVVVLLTWLYLSSYILLFGAELNSELEQQTADTTKDAPSPRTDHEIRATDKAAGATPASAISAPLAADRTSAGAEWLASRAAAHVVRAIGLGRVGVVASSAATIGLSLLRRRGRAREGAALLGSAALVAWLGRDSAAKEEPDRLPDGIPSQPPCIRS